jgi:hypothetical protein
MRLLGFSAPLPRRHRFLGRPAGNIGAISVQPQVAQLTTEGRLD